MVPIPSTGTFPPTPARYVFDSGLSVRNSFLSLLIVAEAMGSMPNGLDAVSSVTSTSKAVFPSDRPRPKIDLNE